MSTYEVTPYTKAKSNALADQAQAEADKAQEALNLDAMTPSELEAVTHPKLKAYARLKIRAMKARYCGNIAQAVLLEDKCEKSYKRLPPELRW